MGVYTIYKDKDGWLKVYKTLDYIVIEREIKFWSDRIYLRFEEAEKLIYVLKKLVRGEKRRGIL